MQKLFEKIIENKNIFLKPIFYIFLIISFIYRIIIIHKRKKGYKEKVGNSFIISVGNITLGGTGKTPFVIFLAKKLAKKYKIAIVLRGYKSKYNKKPFLIKNYKKVTPVNIGDEAYLISKKTKMPVIISKSRKNAIILAEKKLKPNLIILDDAFQHFKIKRNINIILIDYLNPFGNEKLFPAGILREPLSSLKDANIIIITKYDKNINSKYNLNQLKKIIRKYNSKAPIFVSNFLVNSNLTKSNKIFAFAGIGNFNYFIYLIKKYLKPKILIYKKFSDHYFYKKNNINQILEFQKKSYKIITTYKDYVKINIPQIYVLDIKFNLFNENKFFKFLNYEIKNKN